MVKIYFYMTHLFQPHNRKHKISKITHRMNIFGASNLQIKLNTHFAL